MKNLAYTTIVIAGIMLLLYFGKNLIIPLVLALFIWFIINGLQEKIRHLKFIEKYVPDWVVSFISAIIIVGVLSLFGRMLTVNINRIIENIEGYEKNISELSKLVPSNLIENLNINQEELMKQFKFSSILQSVANGLTSLIGNLFLVIIYLLFILLEQSAFGKKLEKIAKMRDDPKEFRALLKSLGNTISEYINLKIIVSAITGVASYIVCAIIGLDAPLFWATIIFALNFIPNIGSLVGTLFPAIFAFLQFGTWVEPLQILIIVGIIQVIVGNYVEPLMMGDSLNISALVVILSLSVWGAIWGITGMLLSIPLTVILSKILSQFPSTRAVAILLGNGK